VPQIPYQSRRTRILAPNGALKRVTAAANPATLWSAASEHNAESLQAFAMVQKADLRHDACE
jgi:hypothetical protein